MTCERDWWSCFRFHRFATCTICTQEVSNLCFFYHNIKSRGWLIFLLLLLPFSWFLILDVNYWNFTNPFILKENLKSTSLKSQKKKKIILFINFFIIKNSKISILKKYFWKLILENPKKGRLQGWVEKWILWNKIGGDGWVSAVLQWHIHSWQSLWKSYSKFSLAWLIFI